MKKVFISQLMRDRTDDDILSERKEAIQLVKDAHGPDIEVIDSFLDIPSEGLKNPAVYYLGHSIILLSEADIVVFCRDFGYGRATRIEEMIAYTYGIKTLYL